jgi:hypothetical protein
MSPSMGTSEARWSMVPCLIALAIVLAGFRLADVAPGVAVGEPARAAAEAPWAEHVGTLDAALARQDLPAAWRAWHAGYGAARRSPRWEGFVVMGDAALRIGARPEASALALARARTSYLAGLFRARQQRALDGVLRTAEGFTGLGDREVVEQCLRVARVLAAESRDPEAAARVRTISGQLAAR